MLQQLKLLYHQRCKVENLFKRCSSNTSLTFKSNFKQDEEQKILEILNKCDNVQLTRCNISESRFKKIEKYINKMGPFRSLNEVLEVDGLSQNVLDKICKEIIFDCEDDISKKEVKTKLKKYRELVIPVCNASSFNETDSVTGIYLSVTGISMARICREENKLTHWNMNLLPEFQKNNSVIDTFHLATKLVQTIPPSDIYVFENISPLPQKGQNLSITVACHKEQQDLTAILLTLLNTSVIHNRFLQIQDSETPTDFVENRVYFVKPKLPARLFNILIGREKVSAVDVTSQLVGNVAVDCELPCSPINVDSKVKNTFLGSSTSHKELLGQALLLVVTFIDLFINNNPKSWSALPANKKKS